jgi:pimeloyl-ACP methyl ester carboxylesterase
MKRRTSVTTLALGSAGLETHIADVLGVLTYEDLRDVILIGHSDGGMVATGVADRAADRISKLGWLSHGELDSIAKSA